MRIKAACAGVSRTAVSGFKFFVPTTSVLSLLLLSAGCSSTVVGETPLFASSSSSAYASPSVKVRKEQKQLQVAEAEEDIVEPAPTRRRTTAYLGRAPYICSPSGFGHTSHCFLRASY
ncbi:MAG TPA: hypothetical protein VGO04_01395 [Ensifer sp.]|jgi:hypothetical protein|uniref:hypothetical protein n=1 Tax=Ensifer sp. TaxID=1872086 RepID=UPI002E0DF6D2|nr:hypothetical protein [Ensifer sp.]